MKVKLFYMQGPMGRKKIDGEKVMTYDAFQSEINSWLSENPDVKVTQIHQTQSGGTLEAASVTITIWYT